jgi:hypothetical protein
MIAYGLKVIRPTEGTLPQRNVIEQLRYKERLNVGGYEMTSTLNLLLLQRISKGSASAASDRTEAIGMDSHKSG